MTQNQNQNLILPKPTDYLSADIVERNNIIISNHREQIFAPNENGDCWIVSDVLAYCTTRTCIFWQFNGQTPDHKKLLQFLLMLENYIKLTTWVMNRDTASGPAFREYHGPDGITRRVVLELNDELCPGYGGASFNGQLWAATPKSAYQYTADSLHLSKPKMHQVFFYEVGRAFYDIELDDILDWQMQNPHEWGYWTLGFNGAMTVLAPEFMGVELEYYGMNTAAFRRDRLKDLSTYVNNARYNFDNTWSSYLLPWNQHQSVNDLMSGLLIYLADNFGGIAYLAALFRRLKEQPKTPNKTDRKIRAANLVRAARRAAVDLAQNNGDQRVLKYFRNTLRWTFI